MTMTLTTLSDMHKIESHGNTFNVTVEQVFDPFTKSQAMRVPSSIESILVLVARQT